MYRQLFQSLKFKIPILLEPDVRHLENTVVHYVKITISEQQQ